MITTAGAGLGRRLPATAKFVVGGDVCDCTRPLLDALVAGLCQEGLDVVDLGLLPTPMIYYAKHRLRAAGCAIVTAADCGTAALGCAGLQWMLGDRPPRPEDAAAMEQATAGCGTAALGCVNPSSQPRAAVPHERMEHGLTPGEGRGEGDQRSGSC